MRHPFRAAIIGTGFAGAQHIDALRRLGVRVPVVVGSTPERAAMAAARLGIDHGSADPSAAIDDPAIDVVHVCVPNALHAPIVRAALDAGKHVVCEKPLTTSAAEAFDLAARARAASVVAVVCHNYRFYAMAAELRVRVARGELGRPHLVRGSYLQDWLLADDATSWRIDSRQGGASRAVADIGTHWVDLAETATGRRVEAVVASMGTVHPRRPDWGHVASFERGADHDWVDVDTEDQAVLLLRFNDGLLAAVTISQVAAGHANDLRIGIDGNAGSVEWRQERPDELRLTRSGEPMQVLPRDRATLSAGAASLARLPAGHNEGWSDAMLSFMRATYATIEGERSSDEEQAAPLPTFEDGARHLAFVESALRSHATAGWVSVSDIVSELSSPARREVRSS